MILQLKMWRNQKLNLQVSFQSRNCDYIFVLFALQLQNNTGLTSKDDPYLVDRLIQEMGTGSEKGSVLWFFRQQHVFVLGKQSLCCSLRRIILFSWGKFLGRNIRYT